MSEMTLAKAYEKYFKIGAATSPREFPSHANLLRTQFNSMSPENQMKFGPLHPEKDVWNFDPADQLVSFARENGMVFRAHAPVWHGGTNPWIFENDAGGEVSREELLERLEEQFTVFAARYGDLVQYWDVVNEAIDDDPAKPVLRETNWLRILGEDYLATAFKLAKKVAPNVQLFYNDYDEWLPHKREKICKLLKKLQDEGAPVEGFGMQSHMSIYNVDIDDVKRSIEAFAAFGVRLHVTELDISLYDPKDRSLPAPLLTDEMFERQAQLYIDLFKVYREYSDVIDNVTTWGVADDYTWLNYWPVRGRTNYPLLFYADHRPKPFVQEIIEAAL